MRNSTSDAIRAAIRARASQEGFDIVRFVRADAVPDAYLRYLANEMRAAFKLPGTPIRFNLRKNENPYADR